jgi:hypothetical protein
MHRRFGPNHSRHRKRMGISQFWFSFKDKPLKAAQIPLRIRFAHYEMSTSHMHACAYAHAYMVKEKEESKL